MSAQNVSVVMHFVTSGNCGIPENMCLKETVLSQTIMDTVARFHKVHYNGCILCARVAPAGRWKHMFFQNTGTHLADKWCYNSEDHNINFHHYESFTL
jgi:hypothetical protein